VYHVAPHLQGATITSQLALIELLISRRVSHKPSILENIPAPHSLQRQNKIPALTLEIFLGLLTFLFLNHSSSSHFQKIEKPFVFLVELYRLRYVSQADVGAADQDGCTALHLAAKNGYLRA
jgi:hypothetical protein